MLPGFLLSGTYLTEEIQGAPDFQLVIPAQAGGAF